MPRTGSAPFRDLLVVNGAIAEIAEPGAISASSVQAFDATDRMIIPGLVNAHSHSHGSLAKGLGDKWTLEHLLNAGRWMNYGLLTEDKYLCGLLNAARAGQQGLYRGLRSLWRISGPHARGLRGDRTRLQRCRDARGRGADGRGPQPISGHPGADRQHSRRSARRT